MSRYTAEDCPPHEDGSICDDPACALLRAPGSTARKLALHSIMMDILRGGTDLRTIGVDSEEIRGMMIDQAVTRREPISPEEIEQMRRTVACLGVVLDGLRGASDIDLASVNAQREIDNRSH